MLTQSSKNLPSLDADETALDRAIFVPGMNDWIECGTCVEPAALVAGVCAEYA